MSGLDPDHLDLISARRRFGYQNGSADRSSAGEKILERRIPSRTAVQLFGGAGR
jgi:hypothetical protein